MARTKSKESHSKEPILRKNSVSSDSLTDSDNDLDNVKDDADREGFGNGVEFILTCLGLSVGLGNIWRFPMRAYENGGSAFLIPYLVCGSLFGLPAIYIEFLAGQYQRVSPPIVFRRIMPIMEGIGWMSCMVSACVGIYYIVIISWICIYFVNLCRGHLHHWNRCDNPWNIPETCIVALDQKACNSPNPPGWDMSIPIPEKMVLINETCFDAADYKDVFLLTGTEQYFKYNILKPSKGLGDLHSLNYPVLFSMIFCWILVALLILKGMKIMGKISYVTVVLPYIIVVIMFFRGITLEGAEEGLYYYFGKPDFSKIFTIRTWTEALKQLCFSLSVGHGGLMSMASYNGKKNNCFRDALIIIIGDTAMSIIGGAAVFSTLGFLAHQRSVTVPEVVESGFSLAFVAYPEAISQMPASWLWAALFFLMLFFLGVSTEIAYVEVFCSCLYDQKKSLRNKKWIVVACWCFTLFLIGLVFATDAGLYWLELFDEYAAGFSSVFAVTIEILAIMYLYGASNFKKDILQIMGKPRNLLTKMIGPSSSYFIFNWYFISPLIGIVLISLSFIREYPFNGNAVVYPPIFDIAGWILSFFPLFMIPIFATKNLLYFIRNRFDLEGLIMLQKQHVSYKRIYNEMGYDEQILQEILPEEEPWEESKGDNINLSRENAAGNFLTNSDYSLETMSYSSLSSSDSELNAHYSIDHL